jgi:hypothetical protein
MGDLGKIIPSMYYDLIARVGAGAPFLVALLWNHHAEFGEITWIKIALLLGAGYITGLVLTPFSSLWAPIYLQVRRTSDGPDKNLSRSLWDVSLMDYISAKDKEAGATIAKMRAEAVLSANLFTGFLLLWLISWHHPLLVMDAIGLRMKMLILLLLAICSIQRALACAGREERLYKIHFSNQPL